jgi:hypothetical protein
MRAPGDRASAQLMTWHILCKLRRYFWQADRCRDRSSTASRAGKACLTLSPFGGADGQEPDVVEDDEVGPQDAGDGPGDGVVGTVPAEQGDEQLQGEPGDVFPGGGGLADASSKNVLPVPDGPQTTSFSCRPTHSRVRSAAWVRAGTEDSRSSQASNVFLVGNAALVRRVTRDDFSRPATCSASQSAQPGRRERARTTC